VSVLLLPYIPGGSGKHFQQTLIADSAKTIVIEVEVFPYEHILRV
jgi:hypothetical protein